MENKNTNSMEIEKTKNVRCKLRDLLLDLENQASEGRRKLIYRLETLSDDLKREAGYVRDTTRSVSDSAVSSSNCHTIEQLVAEIRCNEETAKSLRKALSYENV